MPEKICILTDPIRSGKTTRLMQWAENKKNVFGILTPVVEGKRVFFDLSTKHQFKMEAEPNEENVLSVGKFIFSKSSFEEAIDILERAMKNNDCWIIIDEIGPLELNGEGFDSVIKKILSGNNNLKILLVVRDSILDNVLKHYNIQHANVSIITKNDTILK